MFIYISIYLSIYLYIYIYIYIYIYTNFCCWSKEKIKIYFKIGRFMKIFLFFEFIYFYK